MATKTSTKAQQSEARISKLFSQLKVSGEDEDYDRALELVEEILKLSPDDEDALHCKLVSLVQLSEFQEAIKLIDRISKRVGKPQFLFEKAYCLYRQEKYQQSSRTLEQIPPEERQEAKVQDLFAQIHYRTEDYQASAQAFQTALSLDQSNEREANFVAALAYCDSDTVGKMLAKTPVKQDTLEQCFNIATAYLIAYQEAKKKEEAESLLRRAEQLCSLSLEDDPDLTEEEIEAELVPVRVQLGYALQQQGRSEEAMAIYSAILKQKPANLAHTVTAANNIIVLNRDKDIFDSKRKLKTLSNEKATKKLNSQQQLVVMFNRCQFALHTNQIEQCRQLLAYLKKRFPSDELTVLAEAALLFREKKVTDSIAALEKFILDNSSSSSTTLYLTLAQVLSHSSNQSKAMEVLESIPSLPKLLGVVSTLVAQYTAIGDVDSAVNILDQSFNWWKEKRSSDPAYLATRKGFLWEIVQYKMQYCKPGQATTVLELLRSEEPDNLRYLATLISAYSRFDLKKAEELGHSLPKFTVPASVDVDNLEQMPSFRHRRQMVKPETVAPHGNTVKETPKPKKKRKPRLPKNLDPSKPIDAERWLPLRERSYYRRGKKKSHYTTVGRGSQGTTAATAALTAQLDASKPKLAPPTNPEATGKPTAKEVSSPRAKPQKKQPQKKKKKGGRR